MKILIKENNLFFLCLFIINLFVGVLAYFVLPDKFFYDAKTIISHDYSELSSSGSYGFACLFYKITGLKYLSYPIVAMIQYPIVVYILYKIGIPYNFQKINVKNVLVYIAFFMMAIFISMPSKEFITFTYLSIIIFLYQSDSMTSRKKIILSLLILAFFGVFFRSYFLLIPIISIGMYALTYLKLKNKALKSVVYGIFIAVLMSLSVGILSGKNFSQSSRDAVNSERMNSKDANSMIQSPVKTDTWYGETISIIYGFIAVNLPLEGFKHIFSPQIIAFIIWQLLLFYILFVRLSICLNDRHKHPLLLWTLLILFSYFIVQGVFEPDLGTATRHKIGVFPLIYFALYYEHFRKELQQNI